jgi:transcriptional regulator of acetoin/glycerol metabolism
MQLLMDYRWPGNIRELRNCIEHAFVTVAGDRIGYLDLPAEIRDPHNMHLPSIQDEFSPQELEERERIVAALRETNGNRTQAAALLGTSRVTLWKKIGRYAIDVPARGER